MEMSRSRNESLLSITSQEAIDRVCIRFEDSWRQGNVVPRLELFVSELPVALQAAALVELLILELDYRRRQGDEPQSKDYLKRFPRHADAIGKAFAKAAERTSTQQTQVEAETSTIVSCPNGHRLKVTSKAAGKSVRCPKCREVAVVPAAAALVETVYETAAHPTDPSKTLSYRGSSLPTESLPGGQRLGRFELRGLLGKGAFGAVYRAYDPQLDREVALKVPRSGTIGVKEEVARFLREAQAAAQLKHPNIVPIYDAGQVAGRYFIASAYISGRTLRQVLRDGRPGQREAAMLVARLATALNYAHQRGIFHRDIKPENIMLDVDGQPHVMDFGLARRLSGDALRTAEGIQMGTPAYMSPEQARARAI